MAVAPNAGHDIERMCACILRWLLLWQLVCYRPGHWAAGGTAARRAAPFDSSKAPRTFAKQARREGSQPVPDLHILKREAGAVIELVNRVNGGRPAIPGGLRTGNPLENDMRLVAGRKCRGSFARDGDTVFDGLPGIRIP